MNMQNVFRFALVISLFLSGCATVQFPGAAQVVPQIEPGVLYMLQQGSTQLGVAKALAGDIWSYALTNGDNFVFVWNSAELPGTSAFWTVNVKTFQIVNEPGFVSIVLGSRQGQVGEYATVKALVDCMKENGWKVISWSAIDQTTRTAITSFLNRVSSPVFIFMFSGMPTGIDQLYPSYQQ